MSDTTNGRLELLVLGALEGGAAHGYAIIEFLRQRSAGRFDVPEGSLYPVLHRLEARGQLRSRWLEVSGRRRRVYGLTASGRRTLEAGRRDWAGFSAAVRAVIGESR